MNRFFVVSIALGFGLLVQGCSSGYETEKATQICDDVRESQGSCFGTQTMAQCVACYEDCGSECVHMETCPLQFMCEED